MSKFSRDKANTYIHRSHICKAAPTSCTKLGHRVLSSPSSPSASSSVVLRYTDVSDRDGKASWPDVNSRRDGITRPRTHDGANLQLKSSRTRRNTTDRLGLSWKTNQQLDHHDWTFWSWHLSHHRPAPAAPLKRAARRPIRSRHFGGWPMHGVAVANLMSRNSSKREEKIKLDSTVVGDGCFVIGGKSWTYSFLSFFHFKEYSFSAKGGVWLIIRSHWNFDNRRSSISSWIEW